MNDFPEPDYQLQREERIKETALTLHTISLQVAELLRIKEELEARLNALLEHGDDCQKTYTYGKWKVTIKSGFNYTLNIEEYETLGHFLPKGFDPVQKKVKYEVNKNIIKACESYGSAEEKELLSKFVGKKPTKLHVKITPGC
jgi:hypothetical protein